ncbi:MAG: hypothetical protein DDT35_01503 [Firmicutes bacterium]|nr:hypothetical protein [Bacillota bacterium]
MSHLPAARFSRRRQGLPTNLISMLVATDVAKIPHRQRTRLVNDIHQDVGAKIREPSPRDGVFKQNLGKFLCRYRKFLLVLNRHSESGRRVDDNGL